MVDYGLKISKDGYDVLTSTDVNTSMSSKFNSFKVLSQGTLTKSIAPSGSYQVTVSHSLGYKPAFLVFSERQVGETRRYQAPFVDGIAYCIIDAYISTTTLTIDITTGVSSGTGTLNLYYFIFIDNSEA